MNDHSNCGHSHSADDDCTGDIDRENFQPVRLENSNEALETKNKLSSFLEKWSFMIIVYILYGLYVYFNLVILNKVYEKQSDNDFVTYFTIFTIIIFPICNWLTTSVKPIQTDLDHEIKIMQLKKLTLNVNMKSFVMDCQICKKPKFERSSHCSSCGYCVLRRDHHCVWTGTCIGFQNTQYFINYCFWSSLGTYCFLMNYIQYYDRYEILVQKDKVFEIGILSRGLMGLTAVIFAFTSFGILFLFISFILSIISETSYYEKQKDPQKEAHYIVFPSKNNKNNHNPYNKGFVVNFYEIVGPTLLHFIFPIPKILKEDLIENGRIFSKTKGVHPFKMMNYLKEIKSPYADQTIQENLDSMDPKFYLNKAKDFYKNYKIIE